MIVRFFFLSLLLCQGLSAASQDPSKPYVSIITPLYKGEEFVAGFLKDITAQTVFKRCELIFVNGGSPENESAFIEPYLKSHPNISVIHLNRPTTLYHALNRGIEVSKGEYIYYAAVDNRLHPQVIEKLADALDQDDSVDGIYCDYFTSEKANETFEEHGNHSQVTLPDFHLHLLNEEIIGPQPIWRKSLHDRFGYFKDDFFAYGNWEFWNRIGSNESKLKKISFPGTLYYRNPQGVTMTDEAAIAAIREQEKEWIHLHYSRFWFEPPIITDVVCDEKPFVIVTPSYNNHKWYELNLNSIFSQHYSNFRVIYIDDASSDGTGELVEEFVRKHNYQSKVSLIKNQNRKGAMANHYTAIHMCDPDEIVVSLDGDDWFTHNTVLKRLNQEYADPNVWLTYGQHAYLSVGLGSIYQGVAKALPDAVIAENGVRDYMVWITSQLRTFYAGLFHKIKKEDLFYDGEFVTVSCDVAMMMPLLEMAGVHSRFIPDVLYVYNRITPSNDDKYNRPHQVEVDLTIRARDKYQPLHSYYPEKTQVDGSVATRDTK